MAAAATCVIDSGQGGAAKEPAMSGLPLALVELFIHAGDAGGVRTTGHLSSLDKETGRREAKPPRLEGVALPPVRPSRTPELAIGASFTARVPCCFPVLFAIHRPVFREQAHR